MPVDPEPADDGTILVDLDAERGVVLSAETRRLVLEQTPDEPLYRSHYSTCPDADGWRRR